MTPRVSAPPNRWVIKHGIAGIRELAEGQPKLVQVDGKDLGIFRVGDEYRAYRNLCPHAAAPVCGGRVTGTVLRCPWHGWEFDLRTGAGLTNPASRLQSYPVEVEGDQLFVWA